jgi:hypothetical protein
MTENPGVVAYYCQGGGIPPGGFQIADAEVTGWRYQQTAAGRFGDCFAARPGAEKTGLTIRQIPLTQSLQKLRHIHVFADALDIDPYRHTASDGNHRPATGM